MAAEVRKRGQSPDSHPPDSHLTIDALARETGMTVRNIRAHQSRGLLPPPEVRARTGYYGTDHVARLKLIQELQANGYNLAAISHLLEGGEGSAEDVLAFARDLLAPFETEQPEVITGEELLERFGTGTDPKLLARVEKVGLLIPIGEGRWEVPSPSLFAAGEAVLDLGVPLERALDVIEQVSRSSEKVTESFIRLFMDQVWKPFDRSGQPDDEWPHVREALERLRPLASEVLVAVFQQRMTRGVERAFGRELEKRRRG